MPTTTITQRARRALLGVAALLALAYAAAQGCVSELEPNDRPAQATPVAGAACVTGTLAGGDQDAFAWTVSHEDAQRPWRFELEGIRGQLTSLELFSLEFAENGADVSAARTLLTLSTPDGRTVTSAARLLAAGTYLLGVSASGGEGPYTLALLPEAVPLGYLQLGPGDAEALERRDDFQLAGQLHGSQAVAWTVTEEAAARLWRLELSGALGTAPRLTLRRPDGSLLIELAVGDSGAASIASLGLEAGTYAVEVLPAGEEGAPFRLTATAEGTATDGHEIEPNDWLEQANAFHPEQELRGTLSGGGDVDHFSFTLSQELAARVLNLEAGATAPMELCLLDEDGYQIRCRSGADARLAALHLPAGRYALSLRATSNETDIPYALTLRDAGAPAAGVVTEPNDSPAWAFPLQGQLGARGELHGPDTDFLRFDVTGEAQLWRVQVVGEGVRELRYHTVGGRTEQADQGEGRLRLNNLYLLPGTHFVSVSGDGGAYAVRFLPLGQPDDALAAALAAQLPEEERAGLPTAPRPDGLMESEPNDQFSRADLLEFGRPRVGLLTGQQDRDYYRFFVADGQHVRLQVLPPADGQYYAQLYWGATRVAQVDGAVGEAITGQEWLPAGDYHLLLNARTPSDDYYQVTLDRLDPFTVAEGRGADYPEWFGRGGEETGAGTQAPELPLELRLSYAAGAEVAAYWPYAQELTLTLNVANPGSEALELALDWHATDAGWRLALPDGLTLAPGQRKELAVPLRIAADAYDDEAVITVRAMGVGGRQRTAAVAITPDSFAEPSASHLAWPVPNELLGGLNAAWLGLGAELVFGSAEEEAVADRQGMRWLLDGMTPLEHDYFNYRMWDWMPRDHGIEELPVTVRLAGAEPAEVAGFLLNPLASEGLAQSLRDFAVHLSLDGVTFDKVLEGTLSPRQVEQAFVLPEPVPARYARLQLLGNHVPGAGPQDDDFRLGTFKVVTSKAAAPFITGLNLADPDLGGHVVWSDPGAVAHSGHYLLRAGEGKYPQSRMAQEQEQAEWVIAFLNGRAAQVSELQWLDHPDSEEDGYNSMFKRVELSVSTVGPSGPWTDIGTWELGRGAGSVAPFVPAEPVWARYVRFRAVDLTPRQRYDWPDAIRIIERAADADYRSALGEWGHYGNRGPYEAALDGAGAWARAATLGNDSREAAALLEPDSAVSGAVELGVNDAWYRMTVPPGQNRLQVTLTGVPTRGFDQELSDADGKPVAVELEADAATITISAGVEPGDYWLRLFEPPRSVVITWDTSGSVNAALPVIYQALARFAQSVSPGVEEVNLLPFDSPFLLRAWSSDPTRVLQAINDDPRNTSSSSGEAALVRASQALADRPGKKAIILLTDGAVARETALWDVLLAVRPQVFASEITAAGDLVPDARYEQALMQDYAAVNGGHYEYVRAQGDFDVSFKRAAAWLRRPSLYLLSYRTDQRWARASAWAEPELKRAQERGLIPDSLVGADLTAPVTRAEFAAVAVRVYEVLTGVQALPAAANPFTDTADPEVLKAYNTELAVGVSATEFAPHALLNREQAATILTRVFKKVSLPGWSWAADADFQLDFVAPPPFADDDLISAWARESVYFMAANGIITGTGGGAFTPRAASPEEAALGYANATREQALLLAVRLVEKQLGL